VKSSHVVSGDRLDLIFLMMEAEMVTQTLDTTFSYSRLCEETIAFCAQESFKSYILKLVDS
jgi:hypothetical protein